MMKKLIALLVTACMLITLVPAAAFAYSTGGDQQTEPAVSQELAVTPESAETPAEPAEGVEAEDPDLEAAATEGWTQDPATGKWMFYVNDVPVVGFQTFGTSKYYFDISGYMVVDWQTIDGKRYYFDPTPGTPGAPGSTYGVMKTGWQTLNGNKYYFNPNSGAMHTGWLTLYGEKYYFKPNTGVMNTGWLKLNGNKYWFKDNGQMVTGSKKIGAYKYYFNVSNGHMETGWVNHDGYKFYYKPGNGHMKTGWLKLNGKKYWFTNSGHMVTGMKTIDGYKYYFSDSGVMQTGAKKINGALYYFYSSGKAVSSKGWFKGSDGKTRYSLGGGKVATGTKQIGSNWYEFSKKTGVCLRNLGDNYDRQIKNKSSRTSYLIQVIKSKYQVRVYKGKKGSWSKIYTFTCGIGAPGHETASGNFTVQGKTAHHNYRTGGKNAHWNNGLDLTGSGPKGNGFNGYVWSDTYPEGSIIDSRLGGKVTGGRVRVSENNSAWLYNNIGIGTTVYIH